jgi:hypothetical protein
MPNTPTANVGFVKQTATENPNTWGGYLNDNWDLLDQVLAQTENVALGGANITLTDAQQNHLVVKLTGTLSANVTVTLAATKARFFVVRNTCAMGAFTITIAGAVSGTLDVQSGANVLVFSDGSTVYGLTGGNGKVAAGTVVGRMTGADGGAHEIPLRYTAGVGFGLSCSPTSGFVLTALSPIILGSATKLDPTIGASLTSVGISSFEQGSGGVATASFMHAGGGTQSVLIFRQGSAPITCGSISVTGASVTSYNTTSDYRLKDDVHKIAAALERVRALRPIRYSFKTDPSRVLDGFLAHEVAAVVPEAVIGEKDGEEMQQLDASKLIPLLTAAIQNLADRIDILEQRGR